MERPASTPKTTLFGLMVAIALVSLACGGAATPGRDDIHEQESSRASEGLAPDIRVMTEYGEHHLSEQRGKVMTLYFSFPG